MLDRAKLMREIQHVAHELFFSDVSNYDCVYAAWERIVSDPTYATRIALTQAPWPLPHWQGSLETIVSIHPVCKAYTAVSIDGSQIYPDRHQGNSCFLINIGSVSITYGDRPGKVFFNSQPHLFIETIREGSGTAQDAVDALRQDYELSAGVQIIEGYVPDDIPKILMFDGTLIFWHLVTKDAWYKEYFLPRYCVSLDKLRCYALPTIGYISVPRSKELVNLVRFALCQEGMDHEEANAMVTHVTDTMLVTRFLPHYARTTVFRSNSAICSDYPEHIRPYFYYLNVGSEIARIEIPAWIAHDLELVNKGAMMVIDQCIKGRGYPVVLAEAHEQAVIKSADRDFFYHLIRKISIEQQRKIIPSPKNIKKRGLGI